MPKAAYYGGQAVIEGVMVRGPRTMAVAVRRPDGTVALKSEALGGLYTGLPRRLPLIRGVVVLWETLALGMRALGYSAQVAAGEDEDELSGPYIWATMAVTFVLVAVVFFAGPVLLTGWLEGALGGTGAVIVEGVLRLALFLVYIVAIGLVPDVRRVFAYHSAEHRAIHAYEAGRPLNVESVRPFPNAHPRCGTGFLLTVMVIALVVFALLGTPPLWWRVLSRVVLLPVIAALSYEIIRLGLLVEHVPFLNWVLKPNLLLQSLTTRDPDDGQIEVALAALQGALAAENGDAAPEEQAPADSPAGKDRA
jgi:uncharacterized protein YqhQ